MYSLGKNKFLYWSGVNYSDLQLFSFKENAYQEYMKI